MAHSAVPGLELSRMERWAWKFRWWRARRRGVAERDAVILEHLRRELTGQRVLVGDIGAAVSELVFDDDERVRLGWCHRPTLRRLRDATGAEEARLVRADHSGKVWALYVATRAGTVPLLTTELRLRPGQGGSGRATASAPGPPGMLV